MTVFCKSSVLSLTLNKFACGPKAKMHEESYVFLKAHARVDNVLQSQQSIDLLPCLPLTIFNDMQKT